MPEGMGLIIRTQASRAMRAGDGGARYHAGAQPLAAHFHQAELGILPIWTRARSFFTASRNRRSTSRSLRLSSISMKSDHDQAGQVAQPELAADLVGGFQVGLARGLLDRMLAVARPELTSIETSASVWL